MPLIEKLRTALLPPPAAILILLSLVAWLSENIGMQNVVSSVEHERTGTAFNGNTAQLVSLPNVFHEAEELDAIVKRSLFLQGREPWAAPKAEVAIPTPELETAVAEPPSDIIIAPLSKPEIALLGVLISGSQSQALVFDQSMQSERWIEQGDEFGEWTVAEVRSDSVLLRARGEEVVVTYNR